MQYLELRDLGGHIVFEAYDEDVSEAEFLCCSMPIPLFKVYQDCRGRQFTAQRMAKAAPQGASARGDPALCDRPVAEDEDHTRSLILDH